MIGMLKATVTTSTGDLKQILQLQQENLPANIDQAELESQGFVTLRHDLKTLQQMHEIAPAIIIKDGVRVVAYALAMPRECRQLIPDLEPMFALFDELHWNDKPLNSCSFYVMGQICIAKAYRGQGLFQQLYLHHRDVYQKKFALIVTEIATRNRRSVRAHEKMGFKTIYQHKDQLDDWVIVAWDWT
jgi:GNAT superfamily N-acetyltransferase